MSGAVASKGTSGRTDARPDGARQDFGQGLARAFAGALIFALPILMTREMWLLGGSVGAGRMVLLLLVFFPVLVLLSWHAGFEPTFRWRDDVVDALVAYAVGFTTAGLLLWLLGAFGHGASVADAVGMLSLQAAPASIGALLAQTQLGEQSAGEQLRGGVEHYGSELFIMGVGALFLAFNIAPTQEVEQIAVRITEWQALLVLVVSLVLMHAFVYGVAFRGGSRRPPGEGAFSLFLRYTAAGYGLTLLLCAWLLWTFGRLDGAPLQQQVQLVVVLALPASVGAAAARLIL